MTETWFEDQSEEVQTVLSVAQESLIDGWPVQSEDVLTVVSVGRGP